MMPAEKHVHKVKRVQYKSGNAVYFCVLPDCNYKCKVAFALGKRTICWRCGEEFIMDEYSIRLAKPHCSKCHKPKNEIEHTEIQLPSTDLMDRLKNALDEAKSKTVEEEGDI